MSMRNEPPDPLAPSERSESNGIDALIDEAARRLVAGEPSSSLRGSVRDRIGRRFSAWGSFVPALAGAAVVIMAIVGRALLGPPGEPDKVRPTNQRAAIESPAGKPQDTSAPTAIQPERTEPRQVTRRRAPADKSPPVEEESPIPPITIAPLTMVQIAVDVSSGVMPIDIAPLQIEPLLGQ